MDFTSDLRTCCSRAFDVFSMSCHVLTDLNRGISQNSEGEMASRVSFSEMFYAGAAFSSLIICLFSRNFINFLWLYLPRV